MKESQFRPLFQVPAPKRDFTGRDQELAELRQVVAERGGAMIYGMRGLGGVGKTELAYKLVEEVGGDYPDGHLLVELGGASAKPMSSAEALAQVIRAFEPQAQLPESIDALQAIYRTLLKGRRLILLLDDAKSAAQVEPLLPHSDCLTVVTSRFRFALPQLHRQDLDALTDEAARELLLSLAPRLERAAAELASLLGRLPLALRLAGSAFAERPDLEPAEYMGKLRDREKRAELVDAAIGFNYETLSEDLRRRWRALAVFPGGFDAAAAAAVWAVEADDANDVLGGSLYPVSLVEIRDGRYRLHDLARDFAASRLGDERPTAERRHVGHYVEVLAEADRLYLEGGENVLAGLALFDREWGNIRTGQAWAAAHADADREAAKHCNAYPSAGAYCLNLRLHSREQITWMEAARSAAAALEDCKAEGNHLGNLGIAYAALGEVEKAIGYYDQALVIQREIGDRRGEGNQTGNLGNAYAALGEVEKAIGYYDQAIVISREIGDRRGEGSDLGSLGNAYAALGEVEKAIGYHDQALVISREIGDRRNEGNHLGNLGLAYADLGEVEKSIGYHDQALVISREIGDRRGEGNHLGSLGLAYARLGEVEKAIGHYDQALVISREIGDRRGEGSDLGNLGLVYADLGEVEKAIEHLEQALRIGQEIKDPRITRVFTEQLDRLRGSSTPDPGEKS